MLEYLHSKLIFGVALCLALCIFLLGSHVDAFALKSKHSSEESSEEINGLDRDWDWDWRDRDKDKGKNKKFKCPSSRGNFADIEDCSAYFMCNNWKSKWKSCQKNRRFDRYRKTCLPFIIAVCDDGSDDEKTTKGVTGVTTPEDNSFTCPSFVGTFPHPDDCSKYYQCTFFVPSMKTCPKTQLFDGVKKQCKPEGEVNCGSRKKPTSETTAGTTPMETSPEPTTPETKTPEPTTPETTTAEPTTPETTTLETTVPETTTLETTVPETTTPDTTTPDTTTPETTTPETTTPETTSPEPTTPEPTTTPSTTPQPTTTPPTTPKPTGPPETDCDEDDLDCIIKETGEIPEWFECPDAVGAHRHPSSNRLFIFCRNWKPFVKKCGQDLVYSEKMRTCVTP